MNWRCCSVMERLHTQLLPSDRSKRVEIIVESRGKNEDKDLELEFLRIVQGQQKTFVTNTQFRDIAYNFSIHRKNENIAGLQISDLIARPIGLNHLKPEQTNRAYNIISEKNDVYGLIKDTDMMKIYPR